MEEANDAEIVQEFLLEAREHLDLIEKGLLALEKDFADAEAVRDIFRSVHTIKGGAGFLGFAKIDAVAHAAEDLLGAMREGALQCNEAHVSLLLGVVDILGKALEACAGCGSDAAIEVTDLVDGLRRSTNASAPLPPPPSGAPSSAEPPLPPPPPPVPGAETPREKNNEAGRGVEKTIRVSEGRLDKMMNLIGELSIKRNQFMALSRRSGAGDDMATATEGLSLLSEELQSAIMQIRLVSIGVVFSKFPRLVRDLAKDSGKKIELKISGQETEVDKAVVEKLSDPLLHLIRNAVDHGLEPPEERLRAGKNETGIVELAARQEGESVVIEIQDDGRGIGIERVKAKAVEKGIASEAEAVAMSDDEAIELIFAAGFSTSETVTDLSGRGVGMDVVRDNIRKLNGSVAVRNRPGKGTRFSIRLPLTMAIIKCMLVEHERVLYAIPVSSIDTIVKIRPRSLTRVGGSDAMVFQNKTLGVAWLSELLEIERSNSEEGHLSVIVLSSFGEKMGLVVDKVCELQELVIKPVDDMLSGEKYLSGSAVLGDGRVALILDPMSLIDYAGRTKKSAVSKG